MTGRHPPGLVVHGGAPPDWLDFSANQNPLGVPEAVAAAISRSRFDRYADLDATAAEQHLAADAGVVPAWVLLTSGATEALRLIATACLRPDARVLVLGPAYGEYARVAALQDATVDVCLADAPAFDPPYRRLLEAVEDRRPALTFIADPNNPTGRSIGTAHWSSFRARFADPADRRLLVIDQSFAPFAAERAPDRELLATERVILVRSLTKRLAIPGIRVGYIVGPPSILDRLRAVRDPWAVGAHAIAAATSATWQLADADRRLIDAWRDEMVVGLASRGLVASRSDANFVLAHVGPDAPGDATVVVAALAARRIAIRSAASFGLPDHVRVAVRSPADQALLFAALDEAALGRLPG